MLGHAKQKPGETEVIKERDARGGWGMPCLGTWAAGGHFALFPRGLTSGPLPPHPSAVVLRTACHRFHSLNLSYRLPEKKVCLTTCGFEGISFQRGREGVSHPWHTRWELTLLGGAGGDGQSQQGWEKRHASQLQHPLLAQGCSRKLPGPSSPSPRMANWSPSLAVLSGKGWSPVSFQRPLWPCHPPGDLWLLGTVSLSIPLPFSQPREPRGCSPEHFVLSCPPAGLIRNFHLTETGLQPVPFFLHFSQN